MTPDRTHLSTRKSLLIGIGVAVGHTLLYFVIALIVTHGAIFPLFLILVIQFPVMLLGGVLAGVAVGLPRLREVVVRSRPSWVGTSLIAGVGFAVPYVIVLSRGDPVGPLVFVVIPAIVVGCLARGNAEKYRFDKSTPELIAASTFGSILAVGLIWIVDLVPLISRLTEKGTSQPRMPYLALITAVAVVFTLTSWVISTSLPKRTGRASNLLSPFIWGFGFIAINCIWFNLLTIASISDVDIVIDSTAWDYRSYAVSAAGWVLCVIAMVFGYVRTTRAGSISPQR